MPEAATVRVDAVETERQRAEASLRWAEDRYRLATEAGKVAVWRMDLASGRFETDGSLERIIGYAPGEIGVEPAAWQKVTHPDDLERTTRLWQQASEGVADRYDCEYRLLHKDGSVRWVNVRGAGQKDRTGRVVSLIGTTWDITERRRAEAALRENEVVRQQALESSPDAVFAIDREYRLLFNNQRHQRVLAASGGQPLQVGEDVLSPAYPPEVRDAWRAAYDRALQGEEFRWETDWTDSDGRQRFFENTFCPLRDTSGETIGVLVVTHDITERKRAERTLQASEERYRAVVEDQTEVIGRFTSDGTIIFVNDVYCRFFGKPAAELLGKQWQPVAVADDLPHIEKMLRMLSPSHPVVTIENRVYAANGEVRWMQFVNRAFFDRQGRLGEIQCVGRDITERKRLEADLRGKDAELRAVSEMTPIMLTRCSRDLRYRYANLAYAKMLGTSPEHIVGRPILEVMGEKGFATIRPRVERVLRGELVEYEDQVHLAITGSSHWVRVAYMPDRDPQGNVVGWVASITDITERKRLEAERAEAVARLVLVEEQERQRLSRELHDQTAQRLVALAVELKTLETNLAAGRPQAERVRTLRRAVDDLQEQVRQLAWDLRAGELVEGGLENALREYVEDWSERSAVSVDCECRGLDGPPLPAPVEATLYRVTQEALANVEKHAQARRVSVLLERDETLVRLTVEDDGRGFAVDAVQDAPDARPRLGLLGMQERAALVGGSLLIESSPGSGTTILVRIPLPTEAKPS